MKKVNLFKFFCVAAEYTYNKTLDTLGPTTVELLFLYSNDHRLAHL